MVNVRIPLAGPALLYLGPPAAHAQYLRRRGLEVLLAYWKPPGAAGPDPELQRLPRQRLEYRSLAVKEMDLSAVLARRPQVAVVQELAHANVPSASHASRHQDVQEMLGAWLGLFIARQAVLAHDGDIGLSSQSGQGSSFWFTPPRA